MGEVCGEQGHRQYRIKQNLRVQKMYLTLISTLLSLGKEHILTYYFSILFEDSTQFCSKITTLLTK